MNYEARIDFVFRYLNPATVADGLNTISAPFSPNINQFRG